MRASGHEEEEGRRSGLWCSALDRGSTATCWGRMTGDVMV